MIGRISSSSRKRRAPFMALAILALLAGMWAGLSRMGWQIPSYGLSHGLLMIGGFLGTLIGLERAAALKRRWGYGAPLASGAGALLLLLGKALVAPAAILILIGSVFLVAIFAVFLSREPSLFGLTEAAGAASWLIGNLLLLSDRFDPGPLTAWWTGFLVLTIVGERLELSRLSSPGRAVVTAFLLAAGITFAGQAVSVANLDSGRRLFGLGLLLLALWLARHDVARRTVRVAGATRFISLCLLSGYFWMAVAGTLRLVYGGVMDGPYFDALLHSLFLGFVFSMIFGHALIIFPSVLGIPIPYRPRFYAHLALLHLSLLLRITGDISGIHPWQAWGGLLNVAAILLFLASTILSALAGTRVKRPEKA